MSHASDFPNTIRETTVFADFKKPLVGRSTRWDYVKKYMPLWKDAIRFRLYYWVLAIVGVYFLFSTPIVSALAAAGAGYFYVLYKSRMSRLTSQRKVIWSH